MPQALQKGFQETSERQTLIHNKNRTEIRFDKKIANSSGKGFLLTKNFHKSANNAPIFASDKRNV